MGRAGGACGGPASSFLTTFGVSPTVPTQKFGRATAMRRHGANPEAAEARQHAPRREGPHHRCQREDRLPDRPPTGGATTRSGAWPGCRDPAQRQRLENVGVRPVPARRRQAVTSRRCPGDFTYVFHAAVDTGDGGLASLRRDQRTGPGRPRVPLPHGQRLRVLLDRARSTRTRDSGRSTRRIHRVSRCGRTTASRRSPGSRSAPGWRRTSTSRSRSSASARPTVPRAAPRPTAWSRMLRGEPIRLHPDAPNNYNPIYEDDYVELGIRAMEVAAAAAGHRQLGRQRDRQRRGVLRLHGRARRCRADLRVHAKRPTPRCGRT